MKPNTREEIPLAEDNSQRKKQTIHLGYGYASGDNYRLGYGMGGMGGLAGYHGVGGVTGTSVYRSSIPKGNERSFKRWGWGHGGYGGHGYGHGHGGWGYAAPYGHPITHPGFTSIGFPGHALASFDVKNRIAQKRGKQKRQIVAPSFGSPLAPFTMPAAVPAPFSSAVAPLALPATYHAPLFTPVAHPVAAIPSFSSLPAATSIPAVPATLPVGFHLGGIALGRSNMPQGQPFGPFGNSKRSEMPQK